MKNILLFIICLSFCGCALISKAQVPTPKAVLLSEDKIYTVKAGTEVTSLQLDGKEIGPIVFNYDMKLVAPNVLIAQEEKLNKALFAKIKSDEKNSTKMKIIGGILALLGTLATAAGGAWIKEKFSGSNKK